MKRVVILGSLFVAVLAAGAFAAGNTHYLQKYVAPGQTYDLLVNRVAVATDVATVIVSSDDSRIDLTFKNIGITNIYFGTHTGITAADACATCWKLESPTTTWKAEYSSDTFRTYVPDTKFSFSDFWLKPIGAIYGISTATSTCSPSPGILEKIETQAK